MVCLNMYLELLKSAIVSVIVRMDMKLLFTAKEFDLLNLIAIPRSDYAE